MTRTLAILLLACSTASSSPLEYENWEVNPQWPLANFMQDELAAGRQVWLGLWYIDCEYREVCLEFRMYTQVLGVEIVEVTNWIHADVTYTNYYGEAVTGLYAEQPMSYMDLVVQKQDGPPGLPDNYYNLSTWIPAWIVTTGVPLPGDYNDDGKVDAADYTVMRDLGGNIFHEFVWQLNFGDVLPVGFSHEVPEPSGLVLAVLGIAGIVGRRFLAR